MPVFIKVARRYHLFDEPDAARKLHSGNIPFIGGICFSLVFVLVNILMVIFDGIHVVHAQYEKIATMSVYIAEAGTIIFFLGIADDILDLPFTRKFIFQFFATFFLILGAIKSGLFPKVFDVQSSSILLNSFGTTISVLWFVGLTNAINMIDGMDGLAGGTALIASVAMTILAVMWGNLILALALLILIGVLAGFLVFNLPPARIFMGDTGSMFLGFLLGVASWMIVDAAPIRLTSVLIPIVILGLPITDTLLAFTRRIIRGQNPFSADRFHIHHMLKSRFHLSVPATVALLSGINVVFGACGILVAILPELFGWMIAGVLFLAVMSFLSMLGYPRLVFPAKEEPEPVVTFRMKTNGQYAGVNGNGTAASALKPGARKQD